MNDPDPTELRRAAKLARRIEKHFEEQRTRSEKKELRKQSRARRAGRQERPRRRWSARDVDDDDFDTRAARKAKPEPDRAGQRRAEPAHREPETTLVGQIVGVARGRCRVRTARGDVEAELAPGLSLPTPAVGDQVDLEERGELLRIAALRPRTSWLSRRDPGDARRERVLAANLDLATIVVAAEPAGVKTRLIDRFVVVALSGNVTPIVAVNKVDRVTGDELERIAGDLEPYAEIDIEVHLVSALRGDGLNALRAALSGRLNAFVGPSGVGKTSIVNALAPGLDRDVRPVRAADGRGRHTTTASELFELGDGARIVDTPGIRQLALFDLLPADVSAAFPDLSPARLGCRFHDCRHVSEPGCGARVALGDGRLRAARFDSYTRILASLQAG